MIGFVGKLLAAMHPLPPMNQSSLKILLAVNFDFLPRLLRKAGLTTVGNPTIVNPCLH